MATTTDTLIFEIKVDDDAEAVFSAWDKHFESLLKSSKELDKILLIMSKTLQRIGATGSQVFSDLQKTVTDLAPKIKTVKDALSVYDKATQEAKEATKSLASRIKDFYANELRKMRDAVIESIESFVSLKENIKGLGRAFETGFKIATAAVTGFASLALDALTAVFDLVKKVGGVLVDEFDKAFKSSVSLEDALSGAKRTGNLTEEQMTDLAKSVRDLSSVQLQGAVTAEELGEVLEVAGRRGILSGEDFEKSSRQALKFTEDVAKASVALDLSFGKTADALGKIQGAFPGSQATIGQLGNAFNILADSTRAAAPSMIEIAKRAAPALSVFKLSQGDLIGFSGAMDAMGVSSFTSATALQSAFKAMTGSTDEFATTFGINVAAFNKLVQEDMGQAMVVFLQHVQKMATETPGGVQQVSAALSELKISGAGVSTAILGLANLGTELETKFLNPANQGLTNMNSINAEFINSISRVSQLWQALGTIWINTTGQLTDAMLPAIKSFLSVVNQTAMDFQQWIGASGIADQLRASLESLVQTDIIPLVNQFVEWIKTSEALQDFFMHGIPDGIESAKLAIISLISKFETFTGAIQHGMSVWDSLVMVFPKLKQAENILLDIVAAIKEVMGWVEKAGGAVDIFRIAWETIRDTASDIGSVFEPFFDMLVSGFETSKTAIQGFIEIAQGLSKIFTSPLDSIQKLGSGIENVFSSLVKFVNDSIGAVGKLASAIGSIVGKLKDVGQEAFGNSTFPDMQEWIGKNIGAVSNLNSGFGASVSALSAVAKAGKNTGQTLSNMNSQRLAISQSNLPSSIRKELLQATQQQATQQQFNTNQITGQSAQDTQRRSQAAGATIVFQGQNIVNDASRQQYIRETNKGLQKLERMSIQG